MTRKHRPSSGADGISSAVRAQAAPCRCGPEAAREFGGLWRPCLDKQGGRLGPGRLLGAGRRGDNNTVEQWLTLAVASSESGTPNKHVQSF